MSVDWGRPERPAVGHSDAISPKQTLVGYGHSRPNWAALIMSGLPPVATVGADIPARQLRARSRRTASASTTASKWVGTRSPGVRRLSTFAS